MLVKLLVLLLFTIQTIMYIHGSYAYQQLLINVDAGQTRCYVFRLCFSRNFLFLEHDVNKREV